MALPLSDCALGDKLFHIPVLARQAVPLPCISKILTLLVTVPGSFHDTLGAV